MRNPGIILCDEITSSVDAFAEKDIVNTMKNISSFSSSTSIPNNKCTIITIAHRLSSRMHCDKIIVMNKGNIIEIGSHNELLLLNNSLYKSMWNSQMNHNKIINEIELENHEFDNSSYQFEYDMNYQHELQNEIVSEINNEIDNEIVNQIENQIENEIENEIIKQNEILNEINNELQYEIENENINSNNNKKDEISNIERNYSIHNSMQRSVMKMKKQ